MNNVSVSRELLERVRNIMAFHASRCPITPLSNYGGTEEHCAEYRNVFADVKQALAQPSEQPAKAEQPERCKHGVRWPHDCSDCEMELAQRMRAEQPGDVVAYGGYCRACDCLIPRDELEWDEHDAFWYHGTTCGSDEVDVFDFDVRAAQQEGKGNG